jgi:hypothetical protein
MADAADVLGAVVNSPDGISAREPFLEAVD